jgi:glycosyltransferase involved in cell wall biosynthesis
VSNRVSVLHVLGTGDRHGSGLARTVFNLADNLDPASWRTGVVFLREDGPIGASFRKMDIAAEAARWHSGVRDPAGLRRFASCVREFGPQIVHFHAGGRLARIVARAASRARIIAHYHSIFEETGADRARSSAGADVIIANSRATAATVRNAHPVVVYQGVTVRPRVPRATEGSVRVGTAARLVTVKGLPTLLQAFARARDAIAREKIDLTLDIAGDGPQKSALEEEIESLGLADSVRLLGWRDDIPRFLGAWDLYVQSSNAEGFGLSVMEAMAAGLPVIATNVGGLPELVEEKATGLLVNAGDPVAMGDAIAALAPDARRRALMGARGRERVMRYFSIEKEVRSIRDVYNRLLV